MLLLWECGIVLTAVCCWQIFYVINNQIVYFGDTARWIKYLHLAYYQSYLLGWADLVLSVIKGIKSDTDVVGV